MAVRSLVLAVFLILWGCQLMLTVAQAASNPRAQARYQCMRETGGSEEKPSTRNLERLQAETDYRSSMAGRATAGLRGLSPGEEQRKAIEAEQATRARLAEQVQRHELFVACMESKGYR